MDDEDRELTEEEFKQEVQEIIIAVKTGEAAFDIIKQQATGYGNNREGHRAHARYLRRLRRR